MKESHMTSEVTELPTSCKSVMENMESELRKEEYQSEHCGYHVAQLSDTCKAQLNKYEKELTQMGTPNIALVAYQKNK